MLLLIIMHSIRDNCI